MNESSDKIFDAYAEDYDVALARGISVSGERKDYFAQRRIEPGFRSRGFKEKNWRVNLAV
jgi:hypothetical protein